MKVGISLNMLSQPGRSDAAILHEHMQLGDLAEPLGFDSLFAPEHHFTGYAMSPSPLQFRSYYAGRTKRIHLGTGVIVIPWHDPIRIAEQIALLDVMCGGRCIFGFGRGAARVEYEGEFFKIPRISIRPAPISHPERRFYGSANSPESAQSIASQGLGLLIVMHNEWAKAAHEVYDFHKFAVEAGHPPKPPIIVTNVSCAARPLQAKAIPNNAAIHGGVR